MSIQVIYKRMKQSDRDDEDWVERGWDDQQHDDEDTETYRGENCFQICNP